ncbi:MAG: DnaJ domain-containing protein [Deltaproteobacteria bacterium]
MKRALVIGTDRDYCYVIKEFLELRGLSVTVVLNHKDGLERIFYEKPDLTVLELLEEGLSSARIGSISSSKEFEVVDFTNTRKINNQTKPVLIFEDKTHINSLFDFLKINFSDQEANEPSPVSGDKGNLGSIFYPELLVDIYQKKRSGVLSLSSSTNLHIYFTNGAPVFAEGGDIETAIGRILLDRGQIDRETYEKAIEMSSEKKLKFGETLFEMGITSPHELNSFLELQIEEKILSGFYYIKGSYEFAGGSDFTDKIVSYRIDLPKVIYAGVKRYISAEIIEAKDPFIETSPDLEKEINKLGLKPAESRFVQLLKNKASLKQTLKTANLEKSDALELLYFLTLFGLVSITDISIDEIGRMSMEKHIKEKDTLQDGGRIEGLKLDEEGFFTAETGPVAAPENPPVETEEESPAIDNNIASGIPDTETRVPPEGLEETDNQQYNFPEGSESQSEEEQGVEEAGLTYETLEKDPDDIGIGSDYFSELFEEKAKNEIPGEDPIKQEPGPSKDDFHSNSGEDQENKDIAIELPEDTWGENTDEKDISPEPEQDDSLRHMGLGEEKTETADESGPETRQAENDINAPEGLEARPPEQDYSLPYEGGMELELDSQEQPDGEEASSGGSTTPPGNNEAEPGNAADGQWGDFKDAEYASDEEAALAVNELNVEHDIPETQQSEEFVTRVNEFHAAMEEKDYYEVLGLGRDVSGEEIKNAYYSLVKQYHPDVKPNAEKAVREKAEGIFTKLTSAYETLHDPYKREQYDSGEELAELKSQAKYIYEAEIAFNKGVALLVQRDYVGAEKKTREALNMNPEEAAYIGTHAWTMFLAADDKSKVLDEVRKSIEKAIALNDKVPENYYYLGSIHKYNEDLRKAEDYYKKALELDPDYIEAKREIRLLNTRKTGKVNQKRVEKKFWSNLFKK